MKTFMFAKKAFLLLLLCVQSALFAQIRSDFPFSQQGAGPDLRVDSNGNVHIVWSDQGLFYALYDSLFNVMKMPYRISPKNGQAGFPGIAISKEYAVSSWMRDTYTYSQIWGQLFTISGDTVSGNILFDGGCGDFGGYSPNAAFLSDTTFALIWAGCGQETGLSTGIYGRIFNISVSEISTKLLLSDIHGTEIRRGSSRIASNKKNGEFLVVWRDDHLGNNKVFGRLFLPNSTPKDASFLISENAELSDVWFLSTAATPGGNYTVVWGGKVNDRWTIQLRRLDKNGIPIGPSVRVNSNPDSVTGYPAVDIAYEIDGSSVVVWEQKVNGYSRIFAQRYLPDGSPFGENFRVSTIEDTLHQFFPSIAMHHKKIYTAWSSGGKIWANIYDFNDLTVPVKNQTEPVGDTFQLLQNYPNPFNAGTTIRFTLTKPANIRLIIHNVLGKEIVTVVNDRFMSGTQTVYWNGKDGKGNDLPSGIYLSRLIGEQVKQVRKMLLVR